MELTWRSLMSAQQNPEPLNSPVGDHWISKGPQNSLQGPLELFQGTPTWIPLLCNLPHSSLFTYLVCWYPVPRSWRTLVETSTGRGRGQPHPWSAPTAGHVTSGRWSHGLSDRCTSWIWPLGENGRLTFNNETERRKYKRQKKKESQRPFLRHGKR